MYCTWQYVRTNIQKVIIRAYCTSTVPTGGTEYSYVTVGLSTCRLEQEVAIDVLVLCTVRPYCTAITSFYTIHCTVRVPYSYIRTV